MLSLAWLALALSAAFSWAIVNVLDKLIVERIIKRPSTLVILDALLGSGVVAIGWVLVRPSLPSLTEALPAFLAGVLTAIFTLAYYNALRRTDATVVAITIQAVPMFSIAAGIVFFAEQLKLEGWLGVGLILGGALLVSLERSLKEGTLTTNPNYGTTGLVILGLCTPLMAIAYSLQKLSLETLGLMGTFSIARLGSLAAAATLFVGIQTRDDLFRILGSLKSTTKILGFWPVLLEVALNILGVYLIMVAYETGPLTLVVPATSTQALFVIFLILFLNRLRPQTIPDYGTRRHFTRRFLGTLAVILGLYLLAI